MDTVLYQASQAAIVALVKTPQLCVVPTGSAGFRAMGNTTMERSCLFVSAPLCYHSQLSAFLNDDGEPRFVVRPR